MIASTSRLHAVRGAGELCERIAPQLRPQIAAAHMAPADVDLASLLPAERAALSGCTTWVQHRAAGRVCAHNALAQLDGPRVALFNGPERDVLWPAGWTGSITHCDGYAAAIVAREDAVSSLGLDAEPHLPLPDDVLPHISSLSERRQLSALTSHSPEVAWDRALFCAKEATFKAWYPLTRRWLGFLDAEVEIAPSGAFHARVRDALDDGPVAELRDFVGAVALTATNILLAVVIVDVRPHEGAN